MDILVIGSIGVLALIGLVVLYRKSDESSVVEPVEKEKPALPKDGTLKAMTKVELEEFAKESFGVDLDRRKTKANMIVELKSAVK